MGSWAGRLGLIFAIATFSACSSESVSSCRGDGGCAAGQICSATGAYKNRCVPMVDAGSERSDGSLDGTDCLAPAAACDTAAHRCVECVARTDCPAAKPACDTATHSCAECLARTDCTGKRPACDTTTRTCVGCLASSDCAAPAAVCDPT